MKISAKDAKLLYIVGGLLLFVVVYMYVFTPMQDKVSQMKTEIETLEKENKELETQYIAIDTYDAEIKEFRESIKENLKRFPADVKEEDIVSYLLNLAKDNGVELTSVKFNVPVELARFAGVVEVAGEDTTVDMSAKQISATATAKLTYQEFKKVLDYIYKTEKQTTLEVVKVVYDSKAKELNGTFDFSKYALSYEGAEYKPEALPSVSIGQDDVFN